MLSFHRLYENMALAKAGADVSPQSDKAVEVIRAGLNISEDFWDNFIQVIGNPDGVADLLGVSKENVSSWSGRIKSIMDQVDQHDDEKSREEKSKSLPTGNLSLADPVGSTGREPSDLRPTP
jgi:hypothetical protein